MLTAVLKKYEKQASPKLDEYKKNFALHKWNEKRNVCFGS